MQTDVCISFEYICRATPWLNCDLANMKYHVSMKIMNVREVIKDFVVRMRTHRSTTSAG